MKFKIIIIIGLILIFGAAAWLGLPPQKNVSQLNQGEGDVSLLINEKTFAVQFKEGMTAFDLLKEKAEESGLILKTKTYDIGVFIEAIGDKENGQDDSYWLYYVNGQMPQVAADKQGLNPGDEVEFKFEKSPY